MNERGMTCLAKHHCVQKSRVIMRSMVQIVNAAVVVVEISKAALLPYREISIEVKGKSSKVLTYSYGHWSILTILV